MFEELLGNIVGKIARSHVPILKELRAREVLIDAPLQPTYLQDPETRARLASLSEGREPHELVDRWTSGRVSLAARGMLQEWRHSTARNTMTNRSAWLQVTLVSKLLSFFRSSLVFGLMTLIATGTQRRADANPGIGDAPPYQVKPPRRPVRPPKKAPATHMLVISIDGVSFDMFRRQRHRLPNLRRLARQGFWRPLESVFPSMTWGAHVSMVTGQYPRHHGVLGNRWLEGRTVMRPYRDRNVDQHRSARTPSVYDLASKRGWITAALNWPATQGSRSLHYNMPEVMYNAQLPFSLLSSPLRQLLERQFRHQIRQTGRPADFLQTLFGRLAKTEGIETDMLVRDLATMLVRPRWPRWLRGEPQRCSTRNVQCKAKRRPASPRLMLVHLLGGDSWMHRYGTNRWIGRWSLEQADAMVGAILRAYKRAGILNKTVVLVISDHGFVEVRATSNIVAVASARGYEAQLNGHAAFLYRGNKSSAHTDQELAAALRENRCIEAVYGPAAYSALGLPVARRDAARSSAPDEHLGAPALIALSKPHCIFRGSGAAVAQLGHRIGFHGYLPSLRSMHALLIGRGPGIRARGRRKIARLVDVAPTIAWLMGLRWPSRWPAFPTRSFTLDGRLMGDILTPTHPVRR